MGSVPTAPQPGVESPLIEGPTAPAAYVQSGTAAPSNSAVVQSNVVNTEISPGPAWPGNYSQPT
jgi:hypothetical protein